MSETVHVTTLHDSDCHIHLNFRVGVVILDDEIFKFEVIDVRHLPGYLKSRERPRCAFQLHVKN